ncbi:hypothetical protein [Rhizobium wenxiniae]|uniref:hypothetical protein n=1 Tax=Rhizobium wenxiniae TaxID=1737357 RepID=UPI003C1A373E
MSKPEIEQTTERNRDAKAVEKADRDNSATVTVPADEETEGATKALDAPVAPPVMSRHRNETKS